MKSRNKTLTTLKKALALWEEHMPEPKCELYYETPYQLLVSVVLSARATDKSVNQAMKPVYEKGFTPTSLLSMGQQGFLAKIKTIGLAPTKAKHVVALTQLLLEHHNGQVPSTREELEALPGVGRKTANVILGELFHQPTIAVDTHVFRVGKRLGWHNETTPAKAEQALLKIFPKQYLPKGHHWMVLHGRYTCKAIKPACESCYLASFCPSFASSH